MLALAFVPLALEGVVDLVLSSTYFRWALLLFVVAVVVSLLNGLLEITLLVVRWGVVVLVLVGILEFVAPGALDAVLGTVG